MIYAKELRIGNYVKNITSELPYSVIFGVTEEYPYLNEITGFEVVYEHLEGLPITEQWLLDFGAKVVEVRGLKYLVIDGLSFLFNGEDGYYMGLGKGFSVYVGYVHKLQNLYYEIRGKELELKK